MPDSIVIVRPNSDVQNAAAVSGTPSAGAVPYSLSTGASVFAILNNSAGATQSIIGMTGTANTNPQSQKGSQARVGFAVPSLPALSQVKSARLKARGTWTFVTNACFYIVALYGSGGRQIGYLSQSASVAASGTVDVPDVDLGTISITSDDLPVLQGYVSGQASCYDFVSGGTVNFVNGQITAHNVYQLWVEVGYNQAPVATATGPTGAITTPTPTVTWTYSDPETDAQERLHVKCFNSAQYGAGGFNPDTSACDYDSGVIFSGVPSHTLVSPLVNTSTYRAYVQTADVGSNGRFGAWTFIGFTTSYPAPNNPSFTVSGDTTWAREVLTVTPSATGLSTDRIQIQTTNDGVNFFDVRGGPWTSTGGGAQVFYDYEAPLNTPIIYRARALNITSVPGQTIPSGWNAISNNFLFETTWWLKDPINQSLSPNSPVNGQIMVTDFSKAGVVPGTIYRPPNMNTAVVIRQKFSGEQGTIAIFANQPNLPGTIYLQDRDIYALLQPGRTLLLQRPVAGQSWYIQLTGTYTATLVGPTASQWTIAFTWIQVPRP